MVLIYQLLLVGLLIKWFYKIVLNFDLKTDVEISWVLDAKTQRNPRMFFLNDEKHVRNSTMRLHRGKVECRNERVYIAVSCISPESFTIVFIYFLFLISCRTQFVIN